MPEITLHLVRIYRNKKTGELNVKTSTLTGDDLSERMKDLIEVEANSWNKEFELINVSHAFLPFKMCYQI